MGYRKNNRGKPNEETEKKRRCLRNLYKISFKYLWDTAHRDYLISETICMHDKKATVKQLKDKCPAEVHYLNLHLVPETSNLWPVPKFAERALVMADSRGTGALQ